jgi:hypothetical protein
VRLRKNYTPLCPIIGAAAVLVDMKPNSASSWIARPAKWHLTMLASNSISSFPSPGLKVVRDAGKKAPSL